MMSRYKMLHFCKILGRRQPYSTRKNEVGTTQKHRVTGSLAPSLLVNFYLTGDGDMGKMKNMKIDFLR